MLKGWADGTGANMMFLNIKQLLPWDIALPIRSNFVMNVGRRGERSTNGLQSRSQSDFHPICTSKIDFFCAVSPIAFLSDVVQLTAGTKTINQWLHIRLTWWAGACCSSLWRKRQMERVLARNQQSTHLLSFLINYSVLKCLSAPLHLLHIYDAFLYIWFKLY